VTARIDVINGSGVVTNLDQLVQRGVETITGLMSVPEKRGGNLVVPGSHGELHIPGKKYGAANLVSQLWVRGVNPDGTVPGGSDDGARVAFQQNLRTLINLFTVDERLTLRHTLTDGSQREIVGEVTDAIQPEIDSFGRYTNGRFAVALNCASPFWADLTTVSQTISSTGAATLTNFVGADTWMEDLTLTFGPSQSNPRLTQASTGLWVQVGKVIAAGQGAVVNTTAWTVTATGGLSATGLYEALTYGATPLTARWFAMRPEPGGGAPVVQLTQTAGGTGQVTITGKRRYRIG
jgi:hypothetical protein